jgi:hypothetical protein
VRHLRTVLIVAIGGLGLFAASLVVAWRFLHLAGGTSGVGHAPDTGSLLSTSDTITLWLALLGVMIAGATLVVTAVGVWVGLMAIWGYRTFQEELRTRAGTAARDTTLEYVKGDAVRTWLRTEAQGILSDLFKDWKESQDIVASQPMQSASTIVSGEETGKVGKRRQKSKQEG